LMEEISGAGEGLVGSVFVIRSGAGEVVGRGRAGQAD
jgi:hypothetical protein